MLQIDVESTTHIFRNRSRRGSRQAQRTFHVVLLGKAGDFEVVGPGRVMPQRLRPAGEMV